MTNLADELISSPHPTLSLARGEARSVAKKYQCVPLHLSWIRAFRFITVESMIAKQCYAAKDLVTGLVVVLLLTSCGGSHHFRKTNAAETTSTPPYLELRSPHSVGTLHFPPGIYVLDAVDDKGYYYRASQKVVQHSFSGSLLHDGGIFVAKEDERRLRGYVIMASGLTHVGNLSRTDHEFRSELNRE